MAKVLKLTGVSIANPAAPTIAPWIPSVGVPGYSHRYRASKLSGAVGAAITGLTNEIDGVVMPATGTPVIAERAGLRGASCQNGATSGFQKTNAAAGAVTMAVVFELQGDIGNFMMIAAGSGRQFRLSSSWTLGALSGGTASLSIANATVPKAVSKVYLAIMALSADGTADVLSLTGNGASSEVTGLVAPPQTAGTLMVGKPTSGNPAAAGPVIYEELVWNRKLDSTERAKLVTSLSAQYGI